MAKAPAKTGKKKSFKKKEKRTVPTGLVHVQASFNNTIITITDPIGNVIAWSSSGSLGFRGSRKGTPFAAQQASLQAANKAKESGLRSVEVRVSGPRCQDHCQQHDPAAFHLKAPCGKYERELAQPLVRIAASATALGSSLASIPFRMAMIFPSAVSSIWAFFPLVVNTAE